MNQNEVVSRYPHVKHYLVKRWWLRGEDLEDVSQDTMLAILESYKNYRGMNQACFNTFVFGVANNIVRQFIRRKKLRKHYFLKAGLEVLRTKGYNAIAHFENEELKIKISKLPGHYVSVLDMIFYKGYKPKEAALELGILETKVWSYKSDALKQLRRLYSK